MAIADTTRVVGVTPRISPAKFAEVLRDAGSPAASEGDLAEAWSVVEQLGVDPAFALAVFHQESQLGTDAASATVRSHLRNPGHTRTSRTGVGHQVEVPPFGRFIQFPSWTDGWRDLAFRLVDPNFAYVTGLLDGTPPGPGPHRTIRPILMIWAPPGDPNDPGFNDTEIYVRNVVHNMTRWSDLPTGGELRAGEPAGGAEIDCTPFPPPPFDGSDKRVGDIDFHATRRTVQVDVATLFRRRFADPNECQPGPALRQGETFEALYWVDGVDVEDERRWWVTEDGSRIWSGGTRQKPGDA